MSVELFAFAQVPHAIAGCFLQALLARKKHFGKPCFCRRNKKACVNTGF